VAGHAELTDDEHVERCAQAASHLEGHRHATPREGEDEDIRAVRIRVELLASNRPASARS
jgi:hypothetical protein